MLGFNFLNEKSHVTCILKSYLNLNASFPMYEISIGIPIGIGIHKTFYKWRHVAPLGEKFKITTYVQGMDATYHF